MARKRKVNMIGGSPRDLFPEPRIAERAPGAGDDNYEIGQLWVDRILFDVYVLAGFSGGSPQWINAGGGGGTFSSLTVTPGPTAITGAFTLTSGVQNVSIGADAADHDIAIGSATGSSALTIDSGTGGSAIDSTGAISIDAAAASNFTTSVGDLSLISSAGSVVITGAQAAADAIDINASNAAGGIDVDAGTGGIAVDTTGGLSLDAATASNFTVTGAGQDLTLASVLGSVSITSTEDAASSILLMSAGGTSETIAINSTLGTAVNSINLVSDAGGITLTSNLASPDGINLNAVGGGLDLDGALQVNIASAQAAAADSVRIVASAADGGMDLDSGTGGTTIDSTGAVSIDAAAASNFSITGAGDLTLAADTSSVVVSGAEAVIDAVQLTASAGAVQVTGGALAATTGLNLVQGAASALVQVGAGAPAHSAPQGSLYLRTDGSSTSTRAYINTDSSTGWTSITTAA